jgi:UDP-glucuronate 4-epimerase
MAIHKFTRLIDTGRPLPVYGDGTASRDYTYIGDIVEGVASALERPMGFEVINLGGSRATPLKELAALIEKAMDRKAILEFLPDQAGDVPATFASVEKARRLLGYAPGTSLEEGVAKFVEWYRRPLHSERTA